ncbi:hypothetical protein [Rubrivirga sp. IMCC45206]|uniref:hypothetical protein n=1 Tax=Rubrivirga sp. IMCC45206 TaxID=3391614 RepID=UPI00399030F9
MTLTPERLRMLVRSALAAREDDMPCGECDAHVDRFAELTLAGLDPAAALPLVEAHLKACPACHEEFEALVAVLRAEERRQRPWWRRLFGA